MNKNLTVAVLTLLGVFPLAASAADNVPTLTMTRAAFCKEVHESSIAAVIKDYERQRASDSFKKVRMGWIIYYMLEQRLIHGKKLLPIPVPVTVTSLPPAAEAYRQKEISSEKAKLANLMTQIAGLEKNKSDAESGVTSGLNEETAGQYISVVRELKPLLKKKEELGKKLAAFESNTYYPDGRGEGLVELFDKAYGNSPNSPNLRMELAQSESGVSLFPLFGSSRASKAPYFHLRGYQIPEGYKSQLLGPKSNAVLQQYFQRHCAFSWCQESSTKYFGNLAKVGDSILIEQLAQHRGLSFNSDNRNLVPHEMTELAVLDAACFFDSSIADVRRFAQDYVQTYPLVDENDLYHYEEGLKELELIEALNSGL